MNTLLKTAIAMMFALTAVACSPSANSFSSYTSQGSYYTEPGLDD